MLRIAVVDDEKDMREITASCVENALKEYGRDKISPDVEIHCFEDAESFLAWEKLADICILDIEMGKMSGIELGKQLRKEQRELPIIFLTSHQQFALESYDIEAFQYILKGSMKEKLPQTLCRLYEKMELDKASYRVIEHSSKVEKVLYRDILYVRKDNKYVVYITQKDEFRERTTLDKIYKELEEQGFVLIERGFLVNIRHIVKIKSVELHLDNGETIYIGRRLLQDVKKAVSAYWKNHI